MKYVCNALVPLACLSILVPCAEAQLMVSETQKLQPSPQTFLGAFGGDLAIAGERLVVGAYNYNVFVPDPDAVHFFERVGTQWTQVQTELGDFPNGDEDFGFAVDIDGDRAAVGARKGIVGSERPGVVYLYRRDALSGAWAFETKLVPTPADNFSDFGRSLDLEGSRLLVGAPYAATTMIQPGRVHVFELGTGGWNQTATLEASDPRERGVFGAATTLSGDTLAVGEPAFQTPSFNGRTWVFRRTAGGWIHDAMLEAPAPQRGDQFGFALALDGARLLVGAPETSTEPQQSGRAYTFSRSALGWSLEATLVGAGGNVGDGFGGDVALESLRIAVGGRAADGIHGIGDAGSVWLYQREAGAWLDAGRLVASDGNFNDFFGNVTLDRDALVVGASGADGVEADAGAAYVFRLRSPFASTVCVGDGTGAPCPCGNGSPPGAGQGCASADSAQGARLIATGSASAGADELILRTWMPASRPALLLASDGLLAAGSGVPFGRGLRCVGGTVVRLGVVASDAAGDAAFGPGLVARAGFGAGETRHFQILYRDLDAACGPGVNGSSALSILFAP